MKNCLKISILITKLSISQHLYVRYIALLNPIARETSEIDSKGQITPAACFARASGAPYWQPRSQGFSLFVIGKSGKGPGTGRSSMYSDWSMTKHYYAK